MNNKMQEKVDTLLLAIEMQKCAQDNIEVSAELGNQVTILRKQLAIALEALNLFHDTAIVVPYLNSSYINAEVDRAIEKINELGDGK